MQRRKRRGKLAECVGSGNGADRSQLVMRLLADVDDDGGGFVSVAEQTD